MDVESSRSPVDDERPAAPARAARRARAPPTTTVFAVVATGGTTNFGIVDDLAGIADGLRRARAAGCTSTAPTAAPRSPRRACAQLFAGVEHADSFIVDPHKWLFAPFDCCALLYRDPALARAAHTQHAGYLDVARPTADEWNPSDYAAT